MAKLLEHLFFPAMIFANFIKGFDPYDLESWLPLFVLTVRNILYHKSLIILIHIVTVLMGLCIGNYANKFYSKDIVNHGFISVSCSLSVTLNIQLTLIYTLGDLLDLISPSNETKTKAEDRHKIIHLIELLPYLFYCLEV